MNLPDTGIHPFILRSPNANVANGVYLKKGDAVKFIYNGKSARLIVFKLVN